MDCRWVVNTKQSYNSYQNNSLLLDVFDQIKTKTVSSLDNLISDNGISNGFLILYSSKRITLVSRVETKSVAMREAQDNLWHPKFPVKLQLDIFHKANSSSIEIDFVSANEVSKMFLTGLIELKKLSGGLYLLTSLTATSINLCNISSMIETIDFYFTLDLWKQYKSYLGNEDKKNVVEISSKTTIYYINGLVFKDQVLYKYTGKEFIPNPVDIKTLIKLVKCMSGKSISTFLPLMIDKFEFSKKHVDKSISEFLCSNAFLAIYPDLKETYDEVLYEKVLKKNYIKKAKKRFLRNLFYLSNNLDELCSIQENNNGILLRDLYNMFISRLKDIYGVKNRIVVEDNDINSTFLPTLENLDDCINSTVLPGNSSVMQPYEDFNISLDESSTEISPSYVQESVIENANFIELKKEFGILKTDISRELSSLGKANIEAQNLKNTLKHNYKTLSDRVNGLEHKIVKIRHKLLNYKNLEKQMTILEYTLDCLTKESPKKSKHVYHDSIRHPNNDGLSDSDGFN